MTIDMGKQDWVGGSAPTTPETQDIYCAGCERLTEARLTNGEEIYPHRSDLYDLPFWKCDVCKNYVGCHYKTDHPTRPLGVIPTREVKAMRRKIHTKLDPMWQAGNWNRNNLYAHLNRELGYNYHTADVKSVEQANDVLEALERLSAGVVRAQRLTHTTEEKRKNI